MTKNELADRLNHLDPGATLTVKEGELAILFGDGRLTKEVIAVVEAFALDHRCTFSVEPGTRTPIFATDDNFWRSARPALGSGRWAETTSCWC